MHLSAAGLKLLKRSEGFRLKTYVDAAGFKTIGFGHKLVAGEKYPTGITQGFSDQLLAHDVVIAEASVGHLVTVELTQGQFDALVDFVFNLGAGRLMSSTLLADLNAGKYDDADMQLLQWDHAGHIELAALKARRQAEHALWLAKAA